VFLSTRYLLVLCSACLLLQGGASARADKLDTVLRYSFKPNLLSTELIGVDSGQQGEARFNSGLQLAVQNELLGVSFDYNLQSSLNNEGPIDASSFSQQLGASLHSSTLNKLLNLNAGISASSRVTAGGDAYRYRISPGVSKTINDIADVSFKYEYVLDKTSAQALEQEKKAYSMALKGSLQNGRLTWQGDYTNSSVFEAGMAQTKGTELLSFRSNYRVVSDLYLELSSVIRDETRYAGGLKDYSYTERHYGAGVAWSPSRFYSLAFKVNKLDETRYDQQELFGSGTVSWFPQANMEFSLSYGDQLVDGARGLMLRTRFDFDES